MKPYPWRDEHTFAPQIRRNRFFRRTLGIPTAVIGVFFGGPISLIAAYLCGRHWRKHNNAPRTDPAIMFATGALLAAAYTVVFGGALSITVGIILPALILGWQQWTPRTHLESTPKWPSLAASTLFTVTFLWAFTGGFTGIDWTVFSLTVGIDKLREPTNIATLLATLWIYLFPYGLMSTAISVYLWAAGRDYNTQAYLDPRTPTRTAERRRTRTTAEYTYEQPDGVLVPAVVVGDALPWREDKYGIPAQIPIGADTELGHGLGIGANGSGKTVFALTFAEQVINKAIVTLMLDFKGDRDNRAKLAAMAEHNGVPFYSFTISSAAADMRGAHFFDPLDFDSDRNVKATLVAESFEFDTTDEAYYRTAADEWLKLQFAILEHVGLDDGEGTFDFLASTSSVAAAKLRIADLHATDPGIYAAFLAQIDATDDTRLVGYRTNVNNIVDTPAGARMHRPTLSEQQQGAQYIDLRELSGTGSVVYFGLGVGGQGSTARVIGTLIVTALNRFVDYRNNNPELPRDDYVIIADEFGLLKEHSSVFEYLLTNARSAKLWVWMFAQSLTSFDDKISDHILTNVYWFIIFRCPDDATAERLITKTGTVNTRNFVNDVEVTDTMWHGRVQKAATTSKTQFEERTVLTVHDLTSLPNHCAYLWAANSAIEPTTRTQWWRRGRVTFKEAAAGERYSIKDVPMVSAIPSELALADEDDVPTSELLDTEPDVIPQRPITQGQTNTIHMYRDKVGATPANQALTDLGFSSLTALTKDTGSQYIAALQAIHMGNLRRALGNDTLYITEYNKFARAVRKPVLDSTDDIDTHYADLPPRTVAQFAVQLAVHTPRTTRAPAAHESTPFHPSSGGEDIPPPGDADAPDDIDAPPTAPVSVTKTSRRAAFDDADETKQPRTLTPPPPPATSAASSDAERTKKVVRLAFQLINAAPEEYGLTPLHDGRRYSSKDTPTTRRPTRSAWTRAKEDAERHLSPLH